MDIDLDRRTRPSSRSSSPNGSVDIGHRLKMLRSERRWNLTEAGQRTGIAHSTLSKIERNELSPTLGTIQKLADGFGVEITALLASDHIMPALGRRSVTRSGDGTALVTGTCRNGWIASDISKKKMLPFKTRVTSHDVNDYSEWQTHSGEIFVYVLSGTLVVYSEYYEPLTLEEGDSVYYDAKMGHKWISSSEADAEVLWIYAD
ncbi:MAG: XRE family transcriptional regulator [Rhizobiaceae bacterium]